ncbi:hypothetical protein, partial [Lactiplantibacillus paraplantarum]|uniref:hypothetical protein n=1 Tax=Lactiplantibacillus paraplantarum TaxID=60520 RepID=UPI001CDB6ED7
FQSSIALIFQQLYLVLYTLPAFGWNQYAIEGTVEHSSNINASGYLSKYLSKALKINSRMKLHKND